MSTTTMQTVIAITVIILIVLSAANFGLARLAEKRDPPIGKFTECDGVRLHCIDRGDPDAPCVVLFRGNGAMIQDFTISGLVDLLARRKRFHDARRHEHQQLAVALIQVHALKDLSQQRDVSQAGNF